MTTYNDVTSNDIAIRLKQESIAREIAAKQVRDKQSADAAIGKQRLAAAASAREAIKRQGPKPKNLPPMI